MIKNAWDGLTAEYDEADPWWPWPVGVAWVLNRIAWIVLWTILGCATGCLHGLIDSGVFR